jgi:hypothetical protein
MRKATQFRCSVVEDRLQVIPLSFQIFIDLSKLFFFASDKYEEFRVTCDSEFFVLDISSY